MLIVYPWVLILKDDHLYMFNNDWSSSQGCFGSGCCHLLVLAFYLQFCTFIDHYEPILTINQPLTILMNHCQPWRTITTVAALPLRCLRLSQVPFTAAEVEAPEPMIEEREETSQGQLNALLVHDDGQWWLKMVNDGWPPPGFSRLLTILQPDQSFLKGCSGEWFNDGYFAVDDG